MHVVADSLTTTCRGFVVNDKQARNKLSDSKANVDRNNKLGRSIRGNYKLVHCTPGNYKFGDRRKWSVELEQLDKRNYLNSR